MAGPELPRELLERGAPERYFKTPYELITRLPDFTSLAEMKIVLYVLRHTYGFKEWNNTKRITLDEFMHGRKGKFGKRLDNGIGMTKANIIKGIRLAVVHHLLYVFKDETDAARKEKYYAVAFWKTDEIEVSNQYPETEEEKSEGAESESEVLNQHQGGIESIPGEVLSQYPRGAKSIPRSERDTLEKNSLINTKIDKMRAPEVARPDGDMEKEEEKKTEDEPPLTSEAQQRAAEQERQRLEETARAAKQAAEQRRIRARLNANQGETTRLRANLAAASPEASGRNMLEQKITLLEGIRAALLIEQGAEVDSETWQAANTQEIALNTQYNGVVQQERRPTWRPESEQ